MGDGMVNKPIWIAFFSQSGKEIVDLSEQLKRSPNAIITNKKDLEGINDELLEKYFDKLIFIPNKPTVEEYRTAIIKAVQDATTPLYDVLNNVIITLHGYLRVIPKEICELPVKGFYNGHPGLITMYPELKGFNPQDKVIANITKYEWIGSVVHEVTPDVDEGRIICNVRSSILFLKSYEDNSKYIYEQLRKCSLRCWYFVLKEIL